MKCIISEVIMEIERVKNIKVALTHAGKFHADDVFGAAFLKIINPDIKIIRSNSVPNDFEGIVFDIGMGKFDHHMADNEVRECGIPYAAFGKSDKKRRYRQGRQRPQGGQLSQSSDGYFPVQ